MESREKDKSSEGEKDKTTFRRLSITRSPSPNRSVPPLVSFSSSESLEGLSRSQETLSDLSLSEGAYETSRKRSDSTTRRAFLMMSNPVAPPSPKSPKSSPKITTPRHSPRLEIKSVEQDILEGELPLSKEESTLLLNTALEKFSEHTDDTKKKKEIADYHKANGLSIPVKIKTKKAERNYWVVVTGNYHSGSEVYLLDTRMMIDEGANTSVFIAYDLRRAIKVTSRVLNKVMAARDFSAIAAEITGLRIVERFLGLFYGDIGLDYETYIVFLPYVPGKTLKQLIYNTNSEIKKTIPFYKDLPEYYDSKVQLSYAKRFDYALVTVGALDNVHKKCVIHRDISGDNLIVNDESGTALTAALIDFDEMIDMGCDVFKSTKKPLKEELSQFSFLAKAAYIRFDYYDEDTEEIKRELYYVNKHFKAFVLLPTGPDLRRFDIEFDVNEQARRLSADELKKIADFTKHTHTPPKIRGMLNVAYGYGSPELCKSPADAASYKSDLWMLGALLLDIFADENIQQELRLAFKAMMVRNHNHRIELPSAELIKMCPSIFVEQNPIELFDPKKMTLDDFAPRYVYRRFLLPKIRNKLLELLSEDPAARLAHSDLPGLYKNLSDWSLLLDRLATMLVSILKSAEPSAIACSMRVINALTIIQDTGYRLENLEPLINESSQSQKALALDNFFKEKEKKREEDHGILARQASEDFLSLLESRLVSQEEAKQAELKKIAEKHQKQQTACMAIKSLMVGCEELKKNPDAFELLEPLAKCLSHTHKTQEVLDFIKELKQTIIKEEKLAHKK